MNASELSAAVYSQGGFDSTASQTDAATVLSWVNEKRRQLLVESGWSRKKVTIGTTVAAQSTYVLDAGVVDVRVLRVGGGRPWAPAAIEDVWTLQSGEGFLSNVSGVFAMTADASGQPALELSPTPTEAGLAIEGICVVVPSDLTTSPDVASGVPADMEQPIIEGAIALGLARIYERADAAVPHEQAFQAGIVKLRKRAKSLAGSGPQQFRVAGVHF